MRVFKRAVAVFLLVFVFQPIFAQNSNIKEPGNPEWYTQDLYQVSHKKDSGEKFIKRNDGVVVAALKDFQTYTINGQKKMRLDSNLGFSLRDIPLEGKNSVYFYNEAIACFLEAEELLPKAKQWLEKNGYSARSLQRYEMSYPADARIDDKRGYTYFPIKPRQIFCGGKWQTRDRVLGLWDGLIATVTYGYNDSRGECIIVHEYFHACGHSHTTCYNEEKQSEIFAVGAKRATYQNTNSGN